MMLIVNQFSHIVAVTGSIGEGIQMTVEERKQVMSAIIKAAGGKYGNNGLYHLFVFKSFGNM